MELRRITDQGPDSIRSHYESSKWSEDWQEVARMYRALLDHLEGIDHPPVWAYTSHQNLILTDIDDYTKWLVKIIVEPWLEGYTEKEYYRITYRLSPPWSQAYGYTTDVVEVVHLVLDGWKRAQESSNNDLL